MWHMAVPWSILFSLTWHLMPLGFGGTNKNCLDLQKLLAAAAYDIKGADDNAGRYPRCSELRNYDWTVPLSNFLATFWNNESCTRYNEHVTHKLAHSMNTKFVPQRLPLWLHAVAMWIDLSHQAIVELSAVCTPVQVAMIQAYAGTGLHHLEACLSTHQSPSLVTTKKWKMDLPIKNEI